MYVWTGCKLSEFFQFRLRERCAPIARELGLDITGFSLPQHSSLKISFEAGYIGNRQKRRFPGGTADRPIRYS